MLELEAVTYHVAPEALDAAPPADRVHLLPGFDEYLLGHGDRNAALAPEHSLAVISGSNGMFSPTIVVDGEVVGTWRRSLTAREVVIEPRLFGPLADPLGEGLRAAADAYGAYLGRRASLREPGNDRVRQPRHMRAST